MKLYSSRDNQTRPVERVKLFAQVSLYVSIALTAAAENLQESSNLVLLRPIDATPQYEALQQQDIPAHLRVLFGLEQDSRFVVREAVLAELRVLTLAEKRALLGLLTASADELHLRPGELNSLKDSVAKVLKRQVGLSDELAAHLIVLYNDVDMDLVWRDYCIQHLADLYRHDPDNSDIREVLLCASRERAGTLAGTALLAMRKNVSTGFTEDVLTQRAFAVAADATYDDMVRLTALQVCAELGDVRAVPLAREIIGSQSSIHLRMSAIAVLGRLGQVHDCESIKPYLLSSDSRLRTAAKAAVALLNQQCGTLE